MSETYLIRYTPTAAANLKEIAEFIELDSPANAAKFIGKIVAEIDGLKTLPHRHSKIRNVPDAGPMTRSVPVGKYIIRYEIDEMRKAVIVVSVRHGARRPGS